jgi:hypothetical protein
MFPKILRMRFEAVERVSGAEGAVVAMKKSCPICLTQVRGKTQKAARFHLENGSFSVL